MLYSCLHNISPQSSNIVLDDISTSDTCYHPTKLILYEFNKLLIEHPFLLITNSISHYSKYITVYDGTSDCYLKPAIRSVTSLHSDLTTGEYIARRRYDFLYLDRNTSIMSMYTHMNQIYRNPKPEKILVAAASNMQNIDWNKVDILFNYLIDYIINGTHIRLLQADHVLKAISQPKESSVQIKHVSNQRYTVIHSTGSFHVDSFPSENIREFKLRLCDYYYSGYQPLGLSRDTIGLGLLNNIDTKGYKHYSLLHTNPPLDAVSLFEDNTRDYVSMYGDSDSTNSVYELVSFKNLKQSLVKTNIKLPVIALTSIKILALKKDPKMLIYLWRKFGTTSVYRDHIYDYLNNSYPTFNLELLQTTKYKQLSFTIDEFKKALLLDKGMCWSMNPVLYKTISETGPTLECFGSDWNHCLDDFCSLQFEGIENQSIGYSFTDLPISGLKYKNLIVNPPFTEYLILYTCGKCGVMSRAMKDSTFYIFLPRWLDMTSNIINAFKPSTALFYDFPDAIAYTYSSKKYINRQSYVMYVLGPKTLDTQTLRKIKHLMYNERL